MKMNIFNVTILNKPRKVLFVCAFFSTVSLQPFAATARDETALRGLILSEKTLSAIANNTNGFMGSGYATTDIKQTEELSLITKEEIKEKAENAFNKGLFLSALDMYTQLRAFDEFKDAAIYGLILTNIQLGRYEMAHNLTKQLVDIPQFTVPAQKLMMQTTLLLAETAQKNSDFEKAAMWLNNYRPEASYTEDLEKFNRLTAVQTKHSFGHPRQSTSASNTLRIALLLPLSGELKEVGQDLLRSTQMALFKHATQEILLYPHDTKGTAKGARQAVQKAFNDDANIIIGPLTAQSTDAITPFTKSRGIPVISFSSSEAVADKNVMLLSYMPTEQAKLIARHAFDLGKRRFAALIPDSTYGHKVFKAFSDEVEALGGEMVTQGFYNPINTDHSAPLEKMVQLEKAKRVLNKERQALEKEYLLVGGAMDDLELMHLEMLRKAKPQPVIDFEALFIPAPATAMSLISSQLAFYDIDPENVLLLGTALWDSSRIYDNKAEYLKGARFVAPGKNDFEAFKEAFQRVYGNTPHPLAALSYDALAIVSEIFKENPLNKGLVEKKLIRESGFSGISGAFRFTRYGVPERIYNLLEVRPRGFKTIVQAPAFMPPVAPKNTTAGGSILQESFDNFFPW